MQLKILTTTKMINFSFLGKHYLGIVMVLGCFIFRFNLKMGMIKGNKKYKKERERSERKSILDRQTDGQTLQF